MAESAKRSRVFFDITIGKKAEGRITFEVGRLFLLISQILKQDRSWETSFRSLEATVGSDMSPKFGSLKETVPIVLTQ